MLLLRWLPKHFNYRNKGEQGASRRGSRSCQSQMASREEELSMWRDFSWGLEQYLASMDGEFVSDFKDLRDRPDRPVDPSLWGDREKQRSNFLHSALALIKQVKQANGLEAYRLLINSLEPASKNRSLGLLTMILEWKLAKRATSSTSCSNWRRPLENTSQQA